MNELEALTATVRRLSSRAVQAKMDLHDLSEELPANWQRIPEAAQATYNAYRALQEAQEALAIASGVPVR